MRRGLPARAGLCSGVSMPRTAPQTVLAAFLAVAAIAPPAGAQQFVQQTSTRFPTQNEYSNQCSAVDIDNDGDLDLVWANGQGYSTQGTQLQMRVYVNNGAGVFADESSTRAAGVVGWYRGVEAGDVDRDGDMDLVLANDFNKRPQLLINNGAGVFADQTTARLPNITMSSARAQFGDVDNDGDLDLVFCNNGTTRFGSGQPRMFANNGNGIFIDATANLPAGNVAEQMDILFFDVDNDLDLDIFLATRASSPNQSRLWKNDGAGRFSLQSGVPNDAASYSYDAGDIDGDGDLDLIGINAGPSNGELVLKNNGDGTAWTNVSSSMTPNPTTDDNDSRFFDLDMDGDLDLVVGSLGARDRIYLNNGSGAFTETTTLMAAVVDSTIDVKVADFDGDKRFDIVTAQGESGSFQNKIFMNLTGPVDNRAPRIAQVDQAATGGAAPADRAVRANIYDDMTSDRGFHDKGVALNWRVNGGSPQSAAMRWNGNNQWRGVIPAQAPAAAVEYWVTAVDFAGNVGTGATRSYVEGGTAGSPADLNGDGVVNGADLGAMLASWGQPGAADLDGSGTVDGADLGALLAAWTG
jgi:hypothetical protein